MRLLVPAIISISADVQLPLDAMKFVVHVLNLSAKTPAIVVLNAPAEVIVELPRFGPNMFVVRPDSPVSAIIAHLRPDMIQHLIEMIDLTPKPGNGVPILVAVVIPAVITAGIVDCFVSAARVNPLLVVLFGIMGRCGDGEPRDPHNRSGCDGKDFFHIGYWLWKDSTESTTAAFKVDAPHR